MREDEEQNKKYEEIIELLLAAGYFRARIKGLSPFDKVRIKFFSIQYVVPCNMYTEYIYGIALLSFVGCGRDDLVHSGQ